MGVLSFTLNAEPCRMSFRFSVAAFGLTILAACTSTTDPLPVDGSVSLATGGAKPDITPTGAIGTTAQGIGVTRYRLEHHGGPVLSGTSHVYLIWYGNWDGNTAPAILIDLASNLGSSSYFNAVTKYSDSYGGTPNGALIYAGSMNAGYSHGASLSQADVAAMVASNIGPDRPFPLDVLGIYVVLLSADVSVEGFATNWCGYHNQAAVFGTSVRYAVIGNPDRAPSVCGNPIQPTGGPNGNRAADGMASLLAGLLASTVTDPTLTSWYDRNGLELGQKCAWTYGLTYTAPNGSLANIRLGQRDYLLQQLFWPTRKGGVGACGVAEPVQ